MLTDEERKTIHNMSLFQSLPDDILSSVSSLATTRSFEKGAEIFRQHDEVPHLYGVLDGLVKVHRVTSTGEQALLGLFGRGETFGEAAMFLGRDHPASAEAAEDCRLCLFDAAALRTEAQSSPALLFGMMESLSRHLEEMMFQVERLKTRNAKQRVGLYLLDLIDRPDGRARIKLPYDKTLLASRLGMTPESLSRNLSGLRDVGVTVSGQTVSVADCGDLARYCTKSPLRRRGPTDQPIQ